MIREYDYLIVGAGIAGASVAFHLARHGAVAVLERESRPGYHATGRSAATFSVAYGTPLTRALAAGSRSFLMRPPKGFSDVPLLHPRGVLHIAREDQLDALEARHAALAGSGCALERLDTQAIAKRVPALRVGYAAGGLLEPDAMDIDVAALHQGFLRGMQHLEGQLFNGAELVECTRTNGVWRVVTPRGVFVAPALINAAGAWADEVAKVAGVRPLGLQPLRRTAVTFDAEHFDVRSWPMVGDVGAEFYFRPDAGRILASPADQTPSVPCDAQPEELDVAVLMDRIERSTSFVPRRLAAKWAGLRSFVADKDIVAGFDPEAAGFFWLAGQGGSGVMTCVAMSRIVEASVTGQALPDDLTRLELDIDLFSRARPGLVPL